MTRRALTRNAALLLVALSALVWDQRATSADPGNRKTVAAQTQPGGNTDRPYASVPLSKPAERVADLIRQGKLKAANEKLKFLGDDPAVPALRARVMMTWHSVVSPMSRRAGRIEMDTMRLPPAEHVVRQFQATAELDERLKPFVADCIMEGLLEGVEHNSLAWADDVVFSNAASTRDPTAIGPDSVDLDYVYYQAGEIEWLIHATTHDRALLDAVLRDLIEEGESLNSQWGYCTELVLEAIDNDKTVFERWYPKMKEVHERCMTAGRYATAARWGVVLSVCGPAASADRLDDSDTAMLRELNHCVARAAATRESHYVKRAAVAIMIWGDALHDRRHTPLAEFQDPDDPTLSLAGTAVSQDVKDPTGDPTASDSLPDVTRRPEFLNLRKAFEEAASGDPALIERVRHIVQW